jgi:hypothetical protein
MRPVAASYVTHFAPTKEKTMLFREKTMLFPSQSLPPTHFANTRWHPSPPPGPTGQPGERNLDRHSLLRSALGVAAFLLATSPLCAQTHHQLRPGDILVPQSSIEQPGDAGKRMHTHYVLINPISGFHPDGGLGPGGGMTPAQMGSFYGIYGSGSQIIAIVDAYDYPTALNDFNTYSAQFGLPQESSTNVTASTNKVFQIVYAGGSQPPQDATGGWEGEEALDIEWAHAMAPYAKIVLQSISK